MSYRSITQIGITEDIHLQMSRGHITGHEVIHKFGSNPAVGTSYTPVAVGGIWRTPQVSGATTLRIKAGGHANDTAAGSGARTIVLEGLDATGALVTDTLTTAGASASAASTKSFLRLFRAYVETSGTYATQSAGSHAGAITIENSGGGTDWLIISATNITRGQSQVSVYTGPLGYTAYVGDMDVWVESAKAVDVIFFIRENILQTAAPYSGMRAQLEFGAVAGQQRVSPNNQLGPFNQLTDLGFMARGATPAEVNTHFSIIQIKND